MNKNIIKQNKTKSTNKERNIFGFFIFFNLIYIYIYIYIYKFLKLAQQLRLHRPRQRRQKLDYGLASVPVVVE
jgi:hypothetical protein